MIRKLIIGGNWKMFKGEIDEALPMLKSLKKLCSSVKEVEIVVAPPFTALVHATDLLKKSNISVGAQNMYFQEEGAFTGEISPKFLTASGVKYVILGHSERRDIFHETDELVNKKLKTALSNKLCPIICIGEHLNQREEGLTKQVIKDQFERTFKDLTNYEIMKVVIAYEPIWAIGTGKTATPEQAEEIHLYIRELIANKYDQKTAELVRIQYGGSIKPTNAFELFSQPNIDGGLVGGASLEANSFYEIIKAAERIAFASL
jgi:triosephosphate isomerase